MNIASWIGYMILALVACFALSVFGALGDRFQVAGAMGSFALMAGTMFWHSGWVRLKQARLASRLSTSAIRDAAADMAANGMVELRGRVVSGAVEPLIAPISGRPCVWYDVIWTHLAPSGSSPRWPEWRRDSDESLVVIDDGTGECVVAGEITNFVLSRDGEKTLNTADAEEVTRLAGEAPPKSGRYRVEERCLPIGTALFVLGPLHALEPGADPTNDEAAPHRTPEAVRATYDAAPDPLRERWREHFAARGKDARVNVVVDDGERGRHLLVTDRPDTIVSGVGASGQVAVLLGAAALLAFGFGCFLVAWTLPDTALTAEGFGRWLNGG